MTKLPQGVTYFEINKKVNDKNKCRKAYKNFTETQTLTKFRSNTMNNSREKGMGIQADRKCT